MKIKSSWPLLLLCAVTVIFFYPFFFRGLLPIPSDILPGVYYPWHDISYPNLIAGVPVKNALPSDIVSLTYPLRNLAVNLLKAGQLPLWNPYILSGTPLLANFQSAVFNPLNILFFLPLKFYLVWSVQVLLQPFLASLFLYIFLRGQKLSRPASLYGAFVWGFGGFVAIWAGYNTVIHAILTLPLCLWAIGKLDQNRWAGLVLSLSIFYSMVAGNPPMSLILLLTSALFASWIFDNHWKKYVTALIFVTIGLGLSAVLVLPGIELMNHSIRDIDTIAFTANIKYLPLFKLITFVAPDFFGNPSTLNVWSGAGLYDNLTIYLGVVPFMFFTASFFHFFLGERRRLIHFFWFLFFFSLVLSLRNPVSVFVGSLPFLGFSSMVMTRFTAITSLSVAVCSAIIVDELLSGRSKFVNWRASLLLSVGAVLLFLALSSGVGFLAKREITQLAYGGQEILATLITFSNIAFRNSIVPIGVISVSFLSLSMLLLWPSQTSEKRHLARQLVVILLCGLTFFELFRFYHKYNTFSKAEYLYPKTLVTDYLATQSGRFARENAEVIPSNTWLPYEIGSASGYDTLHSLRYNQFLSLLSGSSLSSTSSRYAEIGRFDNKYFDFLGITNIVAMKRKDGVPDIEGTVQHYFPAELFPPIFESGRVAVLQNPRAFPRVFSVQEIKVSSSMEETEELLNSSNPRQTAILEKDPGTEDLSRAAVRKLKVSPQEISFVTEATTSSVVVISESYNSGWRLLIDAGESEVFIANHAFMAIIVPAGIHSVRLFYLPTSIFYGLIISVISLFLLLLGLIYLNKWPKSPQ
jgi:hypothetical protein